MIYIQRLKSAQAPATILAHGRKSSKINGRMKNVSPFVPCVFFIVHLLVFFDNVESTLQQCIEDCRSSEYTTRGVGPTRPYFETDHMGMPLLTTKLYPYHHEANFTTIVSFNITNVLVSLFSDVTSGEQNEENDGSILGLEDNLLDYEQDCIIKTFQTILRNEFESDHVVIVDTTPHDDESGTPTTVTSIFNPHLLGQRRSSWNIMLQFELRYGWNDDIPSQSIDDWTRLYAIPYILDQIIDSSNAATLNDLGSSCLRSTIEHFQQNPQLRKGQTTFYERTQMTFARTNDRLSSASEYDYKAMPKRLVTSVTPSNRYTKFCEVGCTTFYNEAITETTVTMTRSSGTTGASRSATNVVVELSTCHDICTSRYGTYNVSVGYSDPMKTAELECQDGCILALQRCQPGYKCTQPRPTMMEDNEEQTSIVLLGGTMEPCPMGTFRETSYHAVEECLPCPPGTYRPFSRGVSPSSCIKCPKHTFSYDPEQTSRESCRWCPEGTFAHEEGSATCKCITPFSCPSCDGYDENDVTNLLYDELTLTLWCHSFFNQTNN